MNADYLIIAAILNFFAAAMHIAVIIGGADWYRFFGAGEQLAQMAEQGSKRPAIVTAVISSVLAIWGLFALSGAGIIPQLPLLKPALIAITSVYFLRGIGGLIAPFISKHPQITDNSLTFWIVSSLICLAYAGVHLAGTIQSGLI